MYFRIIIVLLGIIGLEFFFSCVIGMISLPLVEIQKDILLSLVLFFSVWLIFYGFKNQRIYFALLISISLHVLPIISSIHKQEILSGVTAISLLSVFALGFYNEPSQYKTESPRPKEIKISIEPLRE